MKQHMAAGISSLVLVPESQRTPALHNSNLAYAAIILTVSPTIPAMLLSLQAPSLQALKLAP